ncbi:hypothetical protein EGW08_023572, partial [Elysia chlorotica]
KKKKKEVYSTWCSQAVTHLSTNHARRCLTSVIGREPVFSTRRRKKKKKIRSIKKKKKEVYSTWCSQAVTHLSTNHARRCLTSVIGREPVFSTPKRSKCHLKYNLKKKEKKKKKKKKKKIRSIKKKKKEVYSTWCSQAVTHLSTNHARRCLTSVIGREPVFST